MISMKVVILYYLLMRKDLNEIHQKMVNLRLILSHYSDITHDKKNYHQSYAIPDDIGDINVNEIEEETQKIKFFQIIFQTKKY